MSEQYENPIEEEPQISPEEFLREQKARIQKRSKWAAGIGIAVVFAHLALFALANAEFALLFQSIFFILGLFAVAGGVYGLFYAKNLRLEDLIPTPEAVEFLHQARETKPLFSYVLIGCLVVVTLFQLKIGIDESAQTAGLVKSLVWKGEYWRLLTSATLHGFFPIHLYFNAQALYGFGSLIEILSNRVHLAIVFLLAIIGGGFLSLFFMPDVISIGASGGIMGLIGYLAVYGYRRRQQLPPDFLKSMLINVGFIAAFGVLAYQIVDNFAHLGGFATGAIYAFFQVPKNLHENSRDASATIKVFGFVALFIFIFACIFSIFQILKAVDL
jgi:membrane associated rhomboid family serine protease